MRKLFFLFVCGILFLPTLAFATPPRAPQGIDFINTRNLYLVNDNIPPINFRIYKDDRGTKAKFQILYSLTPYVKVNPNSDVNNITVLLNGTPLDFVKQKTIVKEFNFPGNYSFQAVTAKSKNFVFAAQKRRENIVFQSKWKKIRIL